jgi:hypothetical protein
MKPRHVCLAVLALFAMAFNVFVWTAADPPDTGAPVVVVFGLFGLAVLCIDSAIEWFTTRGRRETRGFPVKLRGSDHDKT